MVKVILQLYPMLRAESEAEREELRPIGRNVDRFQEYVHQLPALAKVADDLGIWAVTSVEHHFHSEGYEVGPAPTVLAAYLAGITKNIRVGALGYTMSAQNPIRIAEETALIDHYSGGRSIVGFSRGYQARWTDVLGQHYGAGATQSPSGFSQSQIDSRSEEQLKKEFDIDRRNRDVFEENVQLVIDAWTKDTITSDGINWKVPYPTTGINTPMRDVTNRLGAPGEIGPTGLQQAVSVVPRPLQQPHPPVFIASNTSKATLEYAATRGFAPTHFSKISQASEFAASYVDEAAKAGITTAYGQNQALVRWIQIADTTEAAHEQVMKYDEEIYRNLYWPLTPKMPLDPENPVAAMLGGGLFSAGTLEEVKADFIKQWTQLPAEYCVLIYHFPHMPGDLVAQQLELFMKHIKPELDKLTDYED